jgi:hypothetical protein
MPESAEPWVIINSVSVGSSFKSLLHRATQMGRGGEVRSAARIIIQRLESDPLTFGEPLYQLRRLHLQIRAGGEPPLTVRYAVDVTRHLIYVMSLGPAAGSGL